MGRVEGKIALVVGAGGGIGGAGAGGLAGEGAAVVCADIDELMVKATAVSIRAVGACANVLGLDVRDRQAVDAAVAAAVKLVRPPRCAARRGVSLSASFLDLDPGEWDRIIAGQAAARQMVGEGDGGSFINGPRSSPKSSAPAAPPMSLRRTAAGR